ncbi:sigma 54-interacting transcriptional regulator [Alienimonas chondri]|uniref:Anaerobic nitric oxide reductase transcription regulator NorR n=1 Tax=Alienimonas chondri TaxID=2681879 RepID=A0ABX1VFR4_9PLAN|nr:sigma 54-interacting transcriptional regulator [Alienimonas chondri]NNJ26286.1 Anaerobic nitric oxide reductase transcription regulator NorR [Alienimonas chondri]
MRISPASARYLAPAVGAAALLAAIGAITYASVSPDLRLRIELAGDSSTEGVTLVATDGMRVWGDPDADRPEPGDLLHSLGGRTVNGPVDFYVAYDPLFRMGPESFFRANSDDPWLRFGFLPEQPYVEDLAGRRYVRVRFSRPTAVGEEDRIRSAYIRIQGVPVGRMGLLVVWVLLQLGLTAVGAAASWLRPFDRAARLFCLMTATTVVAVSGASLWWALAHSSVTLLPMTVATALLPSVTLHFFLAYPRALPALRDHGVAVRFALYLPAVATVLVTTGGVLALGHLSREDSTAAEAAKQVVLTALSWGARSVIGLAAVGFALTIAAIWVHWRRATSPIERGQLRLILFAAAGSVPAAVFLLYLAAMDRGAFLHTWGFLPVLWISLLFSGAYATGMVKYRLLRADEVLRGSHRLLLARAALMIAAGACVAAAARVDRVLDVPLSPTGSTLVRAAAAVLAAGAVIALFNIFRERLDRTFYREKYRLDRVLRSFSGGQNAARQAASDIVAACREVLGCEQAAVYLPDGDGHELLRAAAIGDLFPDRLSPADLTPAEATDVDDPRRPVAAGPVRSASVRAATGAETIVPLVVAEGREDDGGAAAGWVLLGPKDDRTALSAEDLTFLEAITRSAASAMRESRVRGELERLRLSVRRRDERRERLEKRVASLETELAGTLGGDVEAPVVDGFDRGGLRGAGPAIDGVLRTAAKAARSDVTVLLRGESGTGKELLARAIHANGPRSGGPLVAVHCAALSPALLESELFGHVKGAFTGAERDRPGRFEQASGGTLFLDEIGEVPPETQVKLLRVLQERTFERVGGDQSIAADVRVVAATHRDLEAMIAAGTFREDLFYRLNVLPIALPPLRERPEDLLELADAFLHEAARKQDRAVTRIHRDVEAVLLRHRWPGNVRELRNTMERAVVLAESNTVTLADLPAELIPLRDADVPAPVLPNPKPEGPAPVAPTTPESRSWNRPEAAPRRSPESLPEKSPVLTPAAEREEAEKRRLISVLEACEGNKSKAARKMGLPRSTFYSRLQKHGVVP